MRTAPSVAFPNGEPYVCVAIQNSGGKKRDVLKFAIVGQKLIKNISFTLCSVELMFACTFDKCQGKTLTYVIICLHNNPWKMAELSHIYTAFSRVKEGRCLRVWPAANLFGDMDRLRKFEFSPSIVALDYAYNDEGIFKVDRYIQKWNEFNGRMAQPSRPAAMIMPRPPPTTITVENHSQWYVPFIRLAFQQEIQTNPQWTNAIHQLQSHWTDARPFETAIDSLNELYQYFVPHYVDLKEYISNVPNGYINQHLQEFLLGDFRLWGNNQTLQVMGSLHPNVREAFTEIYHMLNEGGNRTDNLFYENMNSITIVLQSAITLHIHSLNVIATNAYESELSALRLQNHEANEHYDNIHNQNTFQQGTNTTGETRGRGRGRSSTAGRSNAATGHGRGRGRGREGGLIATGVNAHTITRGRGGRDGGRRGRASRGGRDSVT